MKYTFVSAKMMFKLFFIASFVAISQCFLHHHHHHHHLINFQQQCDEKMFIACSNNYYRDLGFTTPVASFKDFVDRVDTLLQKERQKGFSTLCSATHKYTQCLGDQVDVCLSVANLKKLGLSDADAYGSVEIYAAFTYICTPGPYKVLMDNFDCTMKSNQTNWPALDKCAKDFGTAVSKQPDKFCELAQTFITCFAKPFTKDCGHAVGNVICNEIKAEMLAIYPCKNLHCSM